MRIALETGTELVFGKEQNVIIQRVVGCGGSCFIYDAIYQDSERLLHNVRMKECYPYNIALKRKKDNSLQVLFDEIEKFEKSKEQFLKTYEITNRISELLNFTRRESKIIQANGTSYSILFYEEGESYQQYKETSLLEVFKHIQAVAQVIQKYHENGYLHLNIKPENIFIFPKPEQYIQVFDFDSIIMIEELQNSNFQFAISDGFSAPEQLQGKLNKIGTVTDIYALGAVLFYKIFGRTPILSDCNLGAMYDFSRMIYKSDECQPKLYQELELLLHKSICISPIARWKDIKLFIKQIELLLNIVR